MKPTLASASRASTRPVLVCARSFRPIRHVLIAFDGGQSAMKAVDYVARSPLLAGLAVTVLTVGNDTPEARRKLEGAAAQLRDGGLEAEIDIEPGHAAEVISKRVTAGQADLVVMGAFNHLRIRSLIIGSTTTELVRSCPVPVLLFR